MTTELTWSRIQDFSRYQINDDNVVRTKADGKLVPLMAPDSSHPFYHLVSDTQGLCAITQARLSELALDRTD